jgi:hypothetical protein
MNGFEMLVFFVDFSLGIADKNEALFFSGDPVYLN